MVVGSMTVETDVVIIGSGPGGYVAAIRAAQLGKDVIVVEREKNVGGVCLNYGCIPTKAIIHSSNFFSTIKELSEMGIEIKDYSFDINKMRDWKNGILEKLNLGISNLFEKHGIELIVGNGIFTSNNELHIQGQSDVTAIKFKKAIIATGSSPIAISGFPFESPYVITSRDALELTEIPKKLVIIGGGYIGTEMGTVYAKLGSEVHIIEMQDRLLGALDEELVSVFSKKLSNYNVTPHLKSKALGMQEKDGKAIVKINEDGVEKEIEADKVLVVVGRKPNSKDIGLENTDVTINKLGFIEVDGTRRTADTNIYAIGDVIGQPMLAHKASRDAKVAAEVIAGIPSSFDNKVIPFVVFNDPEIASVGLTELDAKNKDKNIQVGKFPLAALGRAMTLNQTDGFVKIIAEKKTGIVLGVHCVGAGASDIIAEATLAIEMGATLEDVALTIHAHPTLPESLYQAAEATMGKAIDIFQPKK